MEIKILVPENRESDLDNFIKDCENKGFELQNRGGGHMPSFSGYYATLKGNNWKPDNNGWIKIEGIANEIKASGDLWVVTKNGEIEFLQELEYLPIGYATHYQPIIKPLPPKF